MAGQPSVRARLSQAARAAFCSCSSTPLNKFSQSCAGWLIGMVDESDVTVISAIQRTEFLQGRDGRRLLDVEAGGCPALTLQQLAELLSLIQHSPA